MKSTLVVALLLMSASAQAFDTRKNPDRVPSLGLSASTQDGAQNGWIPITVPNGEVISSAGREYWHRETDYDVDLRMPISNYLTITLFGGTNNNTWRLSEKQNFTLHETKLGIAVRLFLQHEK